jgi:hypothetical protein
MHGTSNAVGLAVRAAIVGLAIATGAIHLTLGGMLFTMNGLGYLVAAAAMVIPLAFAARYRWLVRIGLVGYALATIVGWWLMGPRYSTAYLAKAIEVALIGLLLVEIRAYDGNPIRRIRGLDIRLRRA